MQIFMHIRQSKLELHESMWAKVDSGNPWLIYEWHLSIPSEGQLVVHGAQLGTGMDDS